MNRFLSILFVPEFALFSSGLWGQGNLGKIVGTARDASGHTEAAQRQGHNLSLGGKPSGPCIFRVGKVTSVNDSLEPGAGRNIQVRLRLSW